MNKLNEKHDGIGNNTSYMEVIDTGDIERVKLLKECLDLFKGKKVVKDQTTRNYKYYRVDTLMEHIDSVLADSGYFFSFIEFGAELYHTSMSKPVKTIQIPKEHWDRTEAGSVSIMSPSQRVIAQSTFCRRLSLELLFNIRTTEDPDEKYATSVEEAKKAEEKKKIGEQKENRFNALMERLEGLSAMDVAKKYVVVKASIKDDTIITAGHKKTLLEKLEQKNDEQKG